MKRILISLAVIFVGILVAYQYLKPGPKKLPVINPVDVEQELVDDKLLRIGYGHKIGEFEFLNQDGEKINDKILDGNITVVEYFFTTCQTICPKMTEQMARVHRKFKTNENVKIFSFTVNPEYDKVPQMREYAQKHNADSKQWHFLTGDKTELYSAARRYFFLLKPAEARNLGDAGGDFIHTNNFVLIDDQRRIRGYYDGTSEKEVDEMMEDMEVLLEKRY